MKVKAEEDKDGEEGGSQGAGGSGSSSQQESSQSSGAEQQDNKKYELKMNGVLNQSEEISWEEIKKEIENLYVSLPTITMDLYQISLNQDDILSFNKEYDELAKVAKDEKKQETLDELTKLYDYMPKFLKNINEQEVYKKLIETKSHIFKAYSKLENDKWNEMVDDMSTAISVYSQLLTDTNINSDNQYKINRMYIMLNELENATTLQDTSVFLIKYKNVIEEIDDME